MSRKQIHASVDEKNYVFQLSIIDDFVIFRNEFDTLKSKDIMMELINENILFGTYSLLL